MRGPRRVGQAGGLVPFGQAEQPIEGAHGRIHFGPRIPYLGEPRRHGVDGKCGRVTIHDLVPPKRRRDPGVRQRADGVGGGDGPVLGVLVVVHEHPVPFLFPPLAGGDVGSAPFDFPRERHGGPADVGERPARFDPGVDVEAPRARRLRPGGQAKILQHRLGHHGDVHDLRPLDARHGVKVDPELVRMIKILGTDRMRVEVNTAQVDHPYQLRGITHHDLAGGPARREAQLDRLDPVRPAVRRSLLEERLALGPVHEPLERHRAPMDTADRAVRDREVVADEVDLRVASTREEDLVRVADRHFPSRCLYHRLSPRHVATLRESGPA